MNTKRAPQFWGELDATGREFFHMYVEKTWPLFRCAQGGWKLDRIACTSYPAWRANHINTKGNWLTKEEWKKRKIKSKTEDEGSSHPKKQKGKLSSKIRLSINDFLYSQVRVRLYHWHPHCGNRLGIWRSDLFKFKLDKFCYWCRPKHICISGRPNCRLRYSHNQLHHGRLHDG